MRRHALVGMVVSWGCGDGVGAVAPDAIDTPPDAFVPDQPSIPELDDRVEAFLDQYEVPGAVVAVAHEGKLVALQAYGLADAGAGQPMQRSLRFRLASVSKPITTAAIMKLVELGEVELDAPAFGYLDALPPPDGVTEDPRLATVTIRQLLDHTGGWNRDLTDDLAFYHVEAAADLGVPSPASPEQLVRWLRGKPLQHDPGERFSYSNAGFLVLGRVIEQVTGEPYEDWVQANILAPAGADGIAIGGTRLAERADDEVYYHPFPGEPMYPSVYAPHEPVTVTYGGWSVRGLDAAGGWIASAPDLVRFFLAIDGHDTVPDVLSAASLAEMTATPPFWEGSDYWYGLGLLVRPVGAEGAQNWWHDGSLPGTGTLVVRSHHDYVWAMLVNTRPQAAGPFHSAIDTTMWLAIETADWPDVDLFVEDP